MKINICRNMYLYQVICSPLICIYMQNIAGICIICQYMQCQWKIYAEICRKKYAEIRRNMHNICNNIHGPHNLPQVWILRENRHSRARAGPGRLLRPFCPSLYCRTRRKIINRFSISMPVASPQLTNPARDTTSLMLLQFPNERLSWLSNRIAAAAAGHRASHVTVAPPWPGPPSQCFKSHTE